MKRKKLRYVLWHPESRQGDFEFLSSTQANWTTSRKKIKEEFNEWLEGNARFTVTTKSGRWRKPTMEEIMDEVGGLPKIYKLTVEEITP